MVHFSIPLNIICSKKCAVSLVSLVLHLDPVSIQTSKVAVFAARFDFVATQKLLGKVVMRAPGAKRIECGLLVLGGVTHI